MDLCRQVQFQTSAREGAVLVLPTGATREELVNPTRLYSYVRDNATSWYQYYNGDSETDTVFPIANGTIFIVIGVDRAQSWATATFPGRNMTMSTKKKHLKFEYNETKGKFPWEDDNGFNVGYKVKQLVDDKHGAIFLRMMVVALSPLKWAENVAYIQPDVVPRYLALSDPRMDIQSRLRKFLRRFIHFSDEETLHFTEVRSISCYESFTDIFTYGLQSATSIHRFLFFTRCF